MTSAESAMPDVRGGGVPKASYLFALAILLVLVGIYPSSPVLIIFMANSTSLGFAIAAGLTIVFLRGLADPRCTYVEGPHLKRLRWLIIGVGVILVMKAGVNYAPIALRELLVLAVAWHLLKIPAVTLQIIIRYMIYIIAALMSASLVAALISYYLGFEYFGAWNIEHLQFLSPDNPLMRRRGDGVYASFYMPFYLAIIPVYDAQDSVAFGLSAFQRQDFIFTEWSYLSYFIGPLIFYCWGDRTMKWRLSIISLFLITFGLTFSVWGVVVLVGTFTLLVLNGITRSPRMIFIVAAIAGLVALASLGVTGLIGLLGGNKLGQFYTYFGDKFDFSLLIRPFGVGTEAYMEGGDDGFLYYGILNVMFVYGVAGVIGYLLITLYFAFLGLATLARATLNLTVTNYAMIAGLVMLVLGVKLTYFVPLFPFLFATFVVKALDGQPILGFVREPERSTSLAPKVLSADFMG